MYQFLAKVFITALIVAGVSELGKKHAFAAAAVASLPLTSILAIVWLYFETQDKSLVIKLSMGIFWMVIPSLTFFLLLAGAMKYWLNFWPALVLACVGTFMAYAGFVRVLEHFKINL